MPASMNNDFEDKTLFMGKFKLARAAYNWSLYFPQREISDQTVGLSMVRSRQVRNRFEQFLIQALSELEHASIDIDFLRFIMLKHHYINTLEIGEEPELREYIQPAATIKTLAHGVLLSLRFESKFIPHDLFKTTRIVTFYSNIQSVTLPCMVNMIPQVMAMKDAVRETDESFDALMNKNIAKNDSVEGDSDYAVLNILTSVCDAAIPGILEKVQVPENCLWEDPLESYETFDSAIQSNPTFYLELDNDLRRLFLLFPDVIQQLSSASEKQSGEPLQTLIGEGFPEVSKHIQIENLGDIFLGKQTETNAEEISSDTGSSCETDDQTSIKQHKQKVLKKKKHRVPCADDGDDEAVEATDKANKEPVILCVYDIEEPFESTNKRFFNFSAKNYEDRTATEPNMDELESLTSREKEMASKASERHIFEQRETDM